MVLETVLTNRQRWLKAQEDGDYVYRPAVTNERGEENGLAPVNSRENDIPFTLSRQENNF